MIVQRVPEPNTRELDDSYLAMTRPNSDEPDRLVFMDGLFESASALPVLEIACGVGEQAYSMALKSNREVIGLDMDGKAIAVARRNFTRSNLKFVQGDGYKLRELFPGKAFSVIFSCQALHHFDRLEELFSAISGVSDPRTVVTIQDFDRSFYFDFLQVVPRKLLRGFDAAFQKGDILDFLERNNLMKDSRILMILSVRAAYTAEEVARTGQVYGYYSRFAKNQKTFSYNILMTKSGVPGFKFEGPGVWNLGPREPRLFTPFH